MGNAATVGQIYKQLAPRMSAVGTDYQFQSPVVHSVGHTDESEGDRMLSTPSSTFIYLENMGGLLHSPFPMPIKQITEWTTRHILGGVLADKLLDLLKSGIDLLSEYD